MRATWAVAVLASASVLAFGGIAAAAGGGQVNPILAGGVDSYDACDPCDECGGRGCRHCHRHWYEGMEEGFNCGCNGSYKFPVPPLYTYHWPGMWSAQLMTDYHSPWRFPPLKPYTDELPRGGLSGVKVNRNLRQVSNSVEAPAREASSFSSHLESFGR
jgi:hypothetical protein